MLFECDGEKMDAGADQFLFERVRHPLLPEIECKRTKDRTSRILDRHRPAGLEPGWQQMFLKSGPAWIIFDVGHNDGFA